VTFAINAKDIPPARFMATQFFLATPGITKAAVPTAMPGTLALASISDFESEGYLSREIPEARRYRGYVSSKTGLTCHFKSGPGAVGSLNHDRPPAKRFATPKRRSADRTLRAPLGKTQDRESIQTARLPVFWCAHDAIYYWEQRRKYCLPKSVLTWIILGGVAFLILLTLLGRGRARPAMSDNGGIPGENVLDSGSQRRLAADKRFASRGTLLSPAEGSFLGTLKLIFNEDYHIFSKVRMADVLQPVQNGSEGKSAFNEISQKHLDFVICRKGTWDILAGVELDDGSHRRSARVVRDTFVEIIFSGAEIPLIRIPARASYSVQELRKTFVQVLNLRNDAASENDDEVSHKREVALAV
jgi:hypothetical protein